MTDRPLVWLAGEVKTKTEKTPQRVIDDAKRRLWLYDAIVRE